MHLVHNWMYFGDATCNQNVSRRVSVHVHCKSNDDCVGCKNGYLVMDIRKFCHEWWCNASYKSCCNAPQI